MKYILDTHIILWWLEDNAKLDRIKRDIIANSENILFVSAVNIWEIEIKRSLGKLKVPDNIYQILYENHFIEMPVRINHVLELRNIKNYHGDPFDKLLIAQASAEKAILLTSDNVVRKYDIETV